MSIIINWWFDKVEQLRRSILAWNLKRLLAKKSESRISLGDSTLDCYTAYLMHNDIEAEALLDGYNEEKHELQVLAWNKQHKEFKDKKLLSLYGVNALRIKQYYKGYNGTYDTYKDYLIGGATGFNKFKIHSYYKPKHYLTKKLFNKKNIFMKGRIETLQYIYDKSLEFKSSNDGWFSHIYSFSALDLMTEKFSVQWHLHPDSKKSKAHLQMYLDSLLSTGELSFANGQYTMTGRAIHALERHERDERRHIDSSKLQRRLVWLTGFLILVGLVQADIVFIPMLVDFSAEKAGLVNIPINIDISL